MNIKDIPIQNSFEIRLEDQLRPDNKPRPKVTKVNIIDAAETAARGDFLELPDPIFVCK